MANRHFFQPLLPGFHSHLTIPVSFFLENVEGRYEQTTAELRSDASKIIWKVKIDGKRLTEGWKEFALAHDLRMGDIVVFRQEKDMSFYVTLLGPSCCEIQYGYCLDKESDSEKIQEESKKRSREGESSSVDSSCLVANVSPSTLRYDLLNLPKSFVRANGIVIGSGKIVLVNEKGRSWTLKLRQKPSCGTVYVRGGWRSFCGANRLKAGDIVTFKLIQRGGNPVLRFLFSKEPEEEANEAEFLSTKPENKEESNTGKIKMKKNPRREIETSSLDPSCFVANVSPATLRYDRLNLPTSFVRKNGLDARCREIVLMNEKGISWTLELKVNNSCRVTYIRGGWRSFCHANGIRAGSFFTFKLIQRGENLVLRLCPTESEEEKECSETNEVDSLSTEPESDEESKQQERISQECSIRKGKKGILIWKPSSSLSQNRFVTLTLRPYNINCSVLRLPVPFTRMNGINEETKVTMLDKHGVKWPVNLRSENDKYKRIRLGGSWKDFLKANCVKTNESIRLELIWEEDSSCVLKFCSKVKL